MEVPALILHFECVKCAHPVVTVALASDVKTLKATILEPDSCIMGCKDRFRFLKLETESPKVL